MRYLNKKGNFLIYVFFTIIPFLVLLLAINLSGESIHNINPINTIWNDELFYYKQIQGTAAYGMPQGYFGYNQSEAMFGTFGAWSPIIIYFYTFLYIILGKTFLSLYISNILLIVVSLVIFFFMNQFSYGKSILYLLPFFSFVILRFSYSAMPECLFYSLILITYGCYLNREVTAKRIIGIILLIFMTSLRPYLGILFIPFIYKEDEKKKSIIRIVVFLVLGVSLYFIITKLFNASAFESPSVAIELFIRNFQDGVIKGFTSNISDFINKVLGRFIWSIRIVLNNKPVTELYGAAVIYLLYYLTCGLYLVRIIFGSNENKKRYIVYLITMIITFLGISYLNANYTSGNRHLFPIMLFGWLQLIELQDRTNRGVVLGLIAGILISNGLYFRDSFYRWAVTGSQEYVLQDIQDIKVSENVLDNTIAFEYGEDINLYRSLYNVNAGIGINLCESDYLSDSHIIKYKYVMLAGASKNRPFYDNDENWRISLQNSKYVIYEQRW